MSKIQGFPDENGWFRPCVEPPKPGYYEVWFIQKCGASCVVGYWQQDGRWQLFNGRVVAWRHILEIPKPHWMTAITKGGQA